MEVAFPCTIETSDIVAYWRPSENREKFLSVAWNAITSARNDELQRTG